MENSRLREAAPTSVNVTVAKRSREYLTNSGPPHPSNAARFTPQLPSARLAASSGHEHKSGHAEKPGDAALPSEVTECTAQVP
jgi:hypothetical protein